MTQDPQDGPLGRRIRDLINPALEDGRRPDIQKKILDNAFNTVADMLQNELEHDFKHFFNKAAAIEKRAPENKNPMIVEALTRMGGGKDGESSYSPIVPIPLPVSVSFTQFSANDLKEMPGYIRLHEVMRDLDVSARFVGLLADESRSGSGIPQPPILVIDASKSYEEGAMENAQLYPQLPLQSAKFDGRRPQNFDL